MADVLTEAGVAELRRGLRRRFLRSGLTEHPDVAADAAMSLVEPVLEAKNTEITRLRARVAKLELPAEATGNRPAASRAAGPGRRPRPGRRETRRAPLRPAG